MHKNINTNWLAAPLLGIGPMEILLYAKICSEGKKLSQSLPDVVLALGSKSVLKCLTLTQAKNEVGWREDTVQGK